MGVKDEKTVMITSVDSSINTQNDTHELLATENAKSRKRFEEAQANLHLAVDGGYKPELKRNFSPLQLVGVGFGLTNSWLGISASLTTAISSGGPMMIVYGILIVAAVYGCIAATLAELSSAMPNAGGQVYWARKIAPPKHAAFATYLAALFSVIGYIFTNISVTMTIAEVLVGLYVFNSGDLTLQYQKWQVFLAFELLNICLIPITIWEKPLTQISKTFLYVSLVGFVVSMVVVLACSLPNFNSAYFVFVEFTNTSGVSAGLAFILGLINPTWAFNGMDGATHLAEESLRPEIDIPRAIMATVTIGLVTAFAFAVAMFFCIKNLDAILASGTGVPIIDIYYQALRSRPGTIALTVLLLLTGVNSNIATHACQSRLAWSVSRDHALPGSKYWSKIHPKTGTPVNAHLMCCGMSAIIGLIYLASSTAYNSMLVACVTFLLVSYCVPVIYLLKRGRKNFEYGPFKLGKMGYVYNYVLLGWSVFAVIFFSFPWYEPVTASNMNYVSAIFVGFAIYCWLYWIFWGKKSFKFAEIEERDLDVLKSQLSNDINQLEAILSR